MLKQISLYQQLQDDGKGGFSPAAAASEMCLSSWLERGCIISTRRGERGAQMPDEKFRGDASRQQSHIGMEKQSDGGVKEMGSRLRQRCSVVKLYIIY